MAHKRSKKLKGQKLNIPVLKREALRFLRQNPKESLTARQLIKRLKVANDKNSMVKALESLRKSKKVMLRDDKYKASGGKIKERGPKSKYIGVVDMVRSGDAFIICDDLKNDVMVRASDLNTALNGDKVEIEVFGNVRFRPRGAVLRVVERSIDQFIGTYYPFKRYGVVVPDHFKVPFDILIAKGKNLDAKKGEKVVVKVTDWAGQLQRAPEGEVIHILGEPGSSEIEMQSILLMNGFNLAFPEDVMKEAEALPDAPREEDFANRRDFRDVTTFTIDPVTARDFDDALSIQTLDDGTIEVGVHIADVTHWVRPGSTIDTEALRRSTSVYLVDRVAPMLPEELSNALCSLRPHETSLCFSAVFKFDRHHKVVDRWFGKTIIYSDHRFAYEDAQEIIEANDGPYAQELHKLNTIAHSLRERKIKNGALSFESDEVQFVLDDEGVPVEIHAKQRKDAHMLVEDFMLLANKEVARHIGEVRRIEHIPFVYRIHDHPDPDKIAELAMFARMLGFQMKIDTPHQIAKSFNALAEAAREDEALAVLEPLAIRTMAKAEYNIENIGHYGLAFTFYTHFTSPIRRYSDVLVHRILSANLGGKTKRWNEAELQDQCKHISAMERRAQKAERDSIKYKLAEYMTKHIGDEFIGHISGMIDRGVFVKIESNHAEGMVAFDSMSEQYMIDSARMTATATRSGDILKMGDEVRVRILDADPSKRQIEMMIV